MWNMAKDKDLGITQDRVKELFDYNQETGDLVWKPYRQIGEGKKTGGRPINAGDIAGYISTSDGYRYVGFDYHELLAHRIIWFWMTGSWPKCQIDHIDRNRANNRWTNLREATNSKNGHNKGPKKNNMSGVVGVKWSKDRQRWSVNICVDRVDHFIGRFMSFDEAVAARKAAEQRYLK